MVKLGHHIVDRGSPAAGAYHLARTDGVEIATDPGAARRLPQHVLDQDLLHDPGSGHGAGDMDVHSGIDELDADCAGRHS